MAKDEEIEVKVLEVDRRSLEKRLISLGAKKEFEKEFNILYFDNGHLKPQKKVLRLREEGDDVVFAYKQRKPVVGAKVAQEIQVNVSDYEKMVMILENIGFNIVSRHTKTRISYSFKGMHVEFDKYHGDLEYIPEFLEIEAKSIASIYRCAKLLNIPKDACKSWSISDVIKYYTKKPKYNIHA